MSDLRQVVEVEKAERSSRPFIPYLLPALHGRCIGVQSFGELLSLLNGGGSRRAILQRYSGAVDADLRFARYQTMMLNIFPATRRVSRRRGNALRLPRCWNSSVVSSCSTRKSGCSGTGAAGCMKVPSDCAAPNLHKSEKYRQRFGAQCIPPVSAKRLYFLSWF